MQSPGKVSLPALACSIALLLLELISRPWAAMGVCDDWSYILSAKTLAETGHVHYFGWASAMVGWQLYLGAVFIKMFGFSFTAPRLGTLLIGLLTAYLMQRTLVRLGIGEGNAVFGTLLFVLSPLFLPLSVTMMTDVPGFFSVLACLYGCIRAVQSERDRESILWVFFAVAVNAVCGTSRQITWLGVLVVVPSTLWLLRSRKRVLLWGAGATALGYLFVFATLHWFNVQPYALMEPFALHPPHIWAWKLAGRAYTRAAVEMGLLLFPLSLPFVAAVLGFKRRDLAGLAGLTLFCVAFVYYLGQKAALLSLLNPFNSDWIGPHAMFDSTVLASQPPTILGPTALASLSLVSIVGILCVGATIFIARPIAVHPRPAISLTWPQLGILFGPLAFVYLLLASRSIMYLILDRYLFTPIFLALVCVLLYSQQHLRVRWTGAAYASLAVLAFYGVISTHNTFALARARVELANEVLATGLPPSHVDLGWEMNGPNELALSPTINEVHIVRPAGTYYPISDPNLPGCHQKDPVYGLFPHLAPRYGIAFDPNVCDGPTSFAPVHYSTWPLWHPIALYVVKYPPPWRPESDYAVTKAPAR